MARGSASSQLKTCLNPVARGSHTEHVFRLLQAHENKKLDTKFTWGLIWRVNAIDKPINVSKEKFETAAAADRRGKLGSGDGRY